MFKGHRTLQIFPVFHSYRNTSSKYIWADDLIARATQWKCSGGNHFYLPSCWTEIYAEGWTNFEFCEKLFPMYTTFLRRASQNLAEKTGFCFCRLVKEWRWVSVSANSKRSKQYVAIIHLFISDFFSVNGQWLSWQHYKIHCVCMYVKHMNALHIIFLTRIILKYFAY